MPRRKQTTCCPACGAVTRPDQRFCGQCGAALRRKCAACAAENPPGQRFCGGCGAPLEKQPQPLIAPDGEAAGSAPREERRWATLLFADLSGFTAMAERMDPEDVKALAHCCA